MTYPDFIVIGAMKCGTTTFAAELAAQDGMFITTPKEPNYFSDDDVFAQGDAWYSALFSDAAPGELKGEASTHYTKLPTHPKTLDRMEALPGHCKFIYMIRNPVERAISQYIHEWSRGGISTAPEAAFEAFPELVEYGRYGWQIAPYIEKFGRDRIILTSLEQFRANPQAELNRVAEFLGHSGFSYADVRAQNVSAERFRPLPMSKVLVSNPVAAFLRRNLVPKSMRERIRKARSIQNRPELPEELRRMIEARFLEDRALLARFFSEHPALDLCYPFAMQDVL